MKLRGRIGLTSGFVGYLLALAMTAPAFGQQAISEVDIWKMIIRDSIVAYGRTCPCPYSPNRAGRACGDHSAYSKRMGSLMCYPQDIPQEKIARYRERAQQQQQ